MKSRNDSITYPNVLSLSVKLEIVNSYEITFKISATNDFGSGNFSLRGGPFLMPDQINVCSAAFSFCCMEISKAPRRGFVPLLSDSSKFSFGISEHNSTKIWFACLLKTCQDLQASMAMRYLGVDVDWRGAAAADRASTISSGFSLVFRLEMFFFVSLLLLLDGTFFFLMMPTTWKCNKIEIMWFIMMVADRKIIRERQTGKSFLI